MPYEARLARIESGTAACEAVTLTLRLNGRLMIVILRIKTKYVASSVRSTKLLQLTGKWQYDGII